MSDTFTAAPTSNGDEHPIDVLAMRQPPMLELTDAAEITVEGHQVRIPTALAQAWLAAPTLPQVARRLRVLGASVRATPDATPEQKRLARQLRAKLAVTSWRHLAEVADDLELPALATSLRGLPNNVPLRSDEVLRASVPSGASPHETLDHTARLLLALEQL